MNRIMVRNNTSIIVLLLCCVMQSDAYDQKYVLLSQSYEDVEGIFAKVVVERVHRAARNYERSTTDKYVVLGTALYKLLQTSGKLIAYDGGAEITTSFVEGLNASGYYIIPIRPERIATNRNCLVIEKNFPWVNIPDDMDAGMMLVGPLNRGMSVVYDGKTIAAVNSEKEKNALWKKVNANLPNLNESETAAVGKIGAVPVLIVCFGDIKERKYAMMGIWETEKAHEYGFEIGEPVYPTEDLPIEKCSALEDVEVETKGFGARCYSYAEVIANKEEIYPQLVWRDELLCSEGTPENPLQYREESNGDLYIVLTKNGERHPPAPDAIMNSNPAEMMDCPDMDYYWELFCKCATTVIEGDEPEQITGGGFYNGGDYLGVEMMKDGYDYTVYDQNGGYTNQVATPDIPPGEPYLFNKNCELINGKTPPRHYAPWAMQAATLYGTYIRKSAWEKSSGRKKFLRGASNLIAPGLVEGKDALDRIIYDAVFEKADMVGIVRQCLDNISNNVFPYVNDAAGILNLVRMEDQKYGANKAQKYAKELNKKLRDGVQNITLANGTFKNFPMDQSIILLYVKNERDVTPNGGLNAANPMNDNRAYQQPEHFYTYDLNFNNDGKPLRTLVFHERERGFVENKVWEQNDKKHWYIQWRYQIVGRDIDGGLVNYGYLIVLEKLFYEEGKLIPPGVEREFGPSLGIFEFDQWNPNPDMFFFEGHKEGYRPFNTSGFLTARIMEAIYENRSDDDSWKLRNFRKKQKRNNHVEIFSGGGNQFYPEWASYSKTSKDYRTDQYDISDRDKKSQKQEAVREIVKKILVAEGVDLAMRGVYYVEKKAKNDYVKAGATATYATMTKIQGKITQSVTGKIAKEVYDGYIIWRQTMDAINDMHKAIKSMQYGWEGLKTAWNNLKEYYDKLDIKKLNIHNIGNLWPRHVFMQLDYQLYCIQSAFKDYNIAQMKMVWPIDNITQGRYGVLTPQIQTATVGLMKAQVLISQETEETKDKLMQKVDEYETKLKTGNERDRAKLANLVRETHNLLVTREWKVRNAGTNALAEALWLIETEATYWSDLGQWNRETFDFSDPKRRAGLEAAKDKSVQTGNVNYMIWQFSGPQLTDASGNISEYIH